MINYHLAIKQRQQLNVNYQTFYIGDGIWLMDDLHIVHTQVEGERKVYMAYGDVHAGLLGGVSSHLINHPILHRGQIKQDGEQDKQQDWAQQNAQYPP